MEDTSLDQLGPQQISERGEALLAFIASEKLSSLAKRSALQQAAGWIVRGDQLLPWRFSGYVRRGDRLLVTGPYVEGELLSAALQRPADALPAVARVAAAVARLTQDKLLDQPLQLNGIHLLADGGVLVLPPAVIRQLTETLSPAATLAAAARVNHPDLTGDQRLCVMLAILSYRAVTGEYPFAAPREDELRDQMRRLDVVPAHLLAPGSDRELSDRITSTLRPQRNEQRPPLREWPPALARAVAEDAVAPVAAEEVRRLRAEAAALSHKYAQAFRRRVFLQRNLRTMVVAAVIVAALGGVLGSIIANQFKPRSTRGYSPRQVVETFYASMGELDHATMEDTVVGDAGKGVINEVVNLFVISRVAQGYEGAQPHRERDSVGGGGRAAVASRPLAVRSHGAADQCRPGTSATGVPRLLPDVAPGRRRRGGSSGNPAAGHPDARARVSAPGQGRLGDLPVRAAATAAQRMIGAAGDLRGMRATVMGLGLHGGGVAAAQFLIRHGARVTVTDLRTEDALQASLDRLAGPVRLVLGRHEQRDFSDVDLVVKNPGVPADSPFLRTARRAGTAVESDVSLFRRLHPDNPLAAVTGSKGKSTTAAALRHALRRWHPEARLGGNITVSPLAWCDELAPHTPVVLELSSWQLADLPEPALLRPRVAVLTNILPDHQDRYPSMRAYVRDKLRIFAGQAGGDHAVLGVGVPDWIEHPPAARVWLVARGALPPGAAGMIVDRGRLRLHDPPRAAVGPLATAAARLRGEHNVLNLAAAALGVAALAGRCELPAIVDELCRFGGLEHRLESVTRWRGVHVVNDSAATMPHATAAALAAVAPPVTLIAGGNDKRLDFTALRAALQPVRAVVLLAGTATAKLQAALAGSGAAIHGPYDRLPDAVRAALAATAPGGTLLFSPAATSFGMFAHEFERGQAFKRAIRELVRNG